MANKLFKSLSKTLLENSAYDKDTNTLFVSNPGISYDVLRGLAKRHGFAIGKTKSGNFVSIPLSQKYSNTADDNYIGLFDSFMETYTYYSKNYANLLAAYKTFDLMDENLAEVGLILDTYTAEVLAQGFTDNPLKISISDSKAQKIVEKILYKNKIYQKLPNITRSIAKYGNYGMVLFYPYLNQWLEDDKNADFNQIDVVEDLSIRFVNPKYFKVNTDEYLNVINYETTDENTYLAKPKTTVSTSTEIWQPWQFVHFAINDEITEPYGKSMLWSMRSAFDQLSTLEALLGISRASKIQRLVFYVPIPNGTAITDAYGYMNEFRTQYLNSIFTDAPGAKAGRKIPGATSILTLPVSADGKKVEVDHIEANIDLSSTEDVDYFKDKIYNNSKLPKGYLVGEDVITTAQTLEAQDLKLKRALIPLKKALLDGLMYLVANILTHAGYDVNKLDIKVTLNEPIQISADVISKYSDIADLVKSFKEVNPQMTNVNQYQLLVKLGMPTDIAQLICRNTTTASLDAPEDLGSFLKNQKIKQKTSAEEMPEEDGVEESAVLSNKQFLMENQFLQRKLQEFIKTKNTTLDRSLKESLLTSQKKILTEDGK